MAEMRAEDLAPGTRFEVEAGRNGMFEVTVLYPGTGPDEFDGKGTGATFTEAAARAIADAEGEDAEALGWITSASASALVGDRWTTGDPT